MGTASYQLLPGKVALVTGGAAGIGEAISKVFARHGAHVVVNGLPGDPVQDVVREIQALRGSAIGIEADVATEVGARSAVDLAIQTFGKLDILIANAGIFPEQHEIPEFPPERFEEVLHSNIRGVFYSVRAALPALRDTRGVILGAGSEAGLMGVSEAATYAASKGWVHAFIRSVAAEQSKYGIRANVVAPGPIDTEMTRPTKGHMKVKTALIEERSPLFGRRGTPEEVANMYLFLASDLASYCTGGIYMVDGGATTTTVMSGVEAKSEAKQAPEGTVELKHQYAGRGTLS
ncbi:MAG: SDR family oxidoreductase [Polyangiaceae bacterium]|nr:SDR family oxidoreductase [Polyangiaceae bacterium]